MSHHQALGGKLVTPVTIFLAIVSAIGLYFLAVRFIYGIGAVANINDGYTWGIWVVYDVVIGTGLACGGYAVALTVYILNKGEYHPLVRPALLASVFGYSLGGFAVLVDLGRWWNFWHIMWPGYSQVNSVMFEVAVCIAAYIVVLWVELSPAFLEKLGMKDAKKKLEKFLFVIIALGVLLPTMHQSSLGSLLIVVGNQIDARWQTILLPLLFLLSAIGMGFSVVIFEATSAAEGFKRPKETEILAKLSGGLVYLLMAYLAIRFVDLLFRGQFGLLFKADLPGLMFWIEIILFAVPIWLLHKPEGRNDARKLFAAAISMILAASIYRIDAFLVAHNPGPEFSYFPAIPELMITIGMIAIEVLAYIVFVRVFPVLEKHDAQHAPAE
jgi:Ni/Fe-hydrogenase subunit HybB-like protein